MLGELGPIVDSRDYKNIRPPKDDNLSCLPEIKNGVAVYEFSTLCTLLPSYESAKLTNLTAILGTFYVTLVFIHTLSDVHTHSPSPLIPWPWPSCKGEDDNQCDSEIFP